MRTAHFSEVHLEADTISITYNSQTEARLDQIYKTDLNELFSYQRKGEKLEEKEKVIEIEIERLRDFKEHPFHVKDDKEMSLLKKVSKITEF